MDQEKIGRFIAKCRKEKNMTQEQLAENLGITDRAVSKWERAKSMPDLSLFKPLCNELGITINELMSGEKVDKSNYQNKLEENMVNVLNDMDKKSKYIKKKYFTIFIATIITILLFIIVFVIYRYTKNKYQQPEIESIIVFGEKIDVIKNKKVYNISMKSAIVKDNLTKYGCVMPIEIKYKNGYKTTETAFSFMAGEKYVYLYSTIDNTHSTELINNIDDNNSIYHIGAYDVFVGVYLDEPLEIDNSCKH